MYALEVLNKPGSELEHMPTYLGYRVLAKNVASSVFNGMKKVGIDFVSSLPESGITEVIRLVDEDRQFVHVPVTNEGLGVAICCGAWLGGKRPALIMGHAGLPLSSYYLIRTSEFMGTPLLLLIGYRSGLGDEGYWHAMARRTFVPILETMRIPYLYARNEEEAEKAVIGAQKTADNARYPGAVLVGD